MKLWTRLWLGAFAVFGTAAAHMLAYWVAAPDPHARADLLAATGHHYWDVAVAVALGALVTGFAGFVMNRMSSVRRASSSTSALYRYAASRLGALQCAAFLALETVERSFVAGDGHGIGISLLALGLLMQLAVALGIAVFLVGLARTVEYLAKSRAVAGASATTPITFVCTETLPGRPRLLRGGMTLRGPPPAQRTLQQASNDHFSNGGFMRTTRIATVVAAVATSMALAAPAWAHVTANPNVGPAEGRVTTFFQAGHGCESDQPDTRQFSVKIPDGVIGVGPEQIPGWSVETKMRELDEPIESEGGEEITEVVDEVVWTAEDEPLDTHNFMRFGLSLNIAAPGEEVLYFPTVQRCGQGSLRWVNIPPSVEEWGATEDPAPFLELTAAEEEEEEAATAEAPDTEEIAELAADQAAAQMDDEVDPIVYVALGVGALGVLIGLAALFRRPRRV